ncbi:NACHT domain-containing protein [Streptomyces sp. NPDC049906]|uniref:NACHT domain-containing protein n=1 Tax=Streptomyces sp. NPDC049906 TaxID=3155656 RepID=UPI003429A187
MTRLPRHERRRRLRRGLLVLGGLLSVVLGGVVVASDQEIGAEQLVSWTSLYAALAALGVALAQLFPPLSPPTDVAQLANDLAGSVSRQWNEEVDARRLRASHVIPLSWSATRRPVAAGPEETHGDAVDARVLRLSLNGRLEGEFDRATRRLAQGFGQVPSGRLVVLGEPGAGKTVLAAMLTLGLLAEREREQAGPVPVLLSLSGWDLSNESFRDWIARTLGTAYYGGRVDIPLLLLRERRLTLVLDGLDEMPEASRRNAVQVINESCGEVVGLALTCRSAEYEDVIKGGSPVLSRAPVVEIAPVRSGDAVAYLNGVSWPAGVDWEPVYERLRSRPAGPTAEALSTPLALSLIRTVYGRCDRHPGELLAFPSRHALENHLLDHVVTAAYAPGPDGRGGHETEDWQRSAQRAEEYLTYLAVHLEEHRERDLLWWTMSGRLSSQLTGLALGTVVGLLAAFAMAGGMSLTGETFDDTTFVVPMLIGFGYAVLTMIVWYAAPGASPGRLSLRRAGSLGRLGRGFAAGTKLIAVLLVPLSAAGAVVVTFSAGWSEWVLVQYVMAVVAVWGMALAVCLALAVHAWFDAPSQRSEKASPWGLLDQDRTSSLTGALAAGAVLGAVVVPLLILGWSAAFIVLSPPTYGPVAPSSVGFLAERFRSSPAYDSKTAAVMATLLPGAVFALLVLLTRAWPRFLLIRLTLAAQGKLPWDLIRFLSEARDRQLLRQSGGAYQFRHMRLQERLASRVQPQDRTVLAGAPTRRLRRTRAAALISASALLVGGSLATPERSGPDYMETGEVEHMLFENDSTLITVDRRGVVKHWSTSTGKEFVDRRGLLPLGRYRDDSRFFAVDGGLLAYGTHLPDSTLIPWRKDRKDQPVTQRSDSWPAAIGSDGVYRLDVVDTEPDSDYYADMLVRSTAEVRKAQTCRLNHGEHYEEWQISRDGEYVAAVTKEELVPYVVVGRFDDCKNLGTLVFGYSSVTSFALKADGSQLAVNADGVTRLRDLEH